MSAVIRQLGGFAQSLLAHQREINGHEESHERLVRTNVRRSFLAADVLFAGLKRQYKAALRLTTAVGLRHVVCHADDASRHLTDKFLRTAHIAYVRTTKLHGNAQRLTIAHSNVSPPLARCLQQGKVEGYTIHDEERLFTVAGIGKACIILNNTETVGLLHNDASYAFEC